MVQKLTLNACTKLPLGLHLFDDIEEFESLEFDNPRQVIEDAEYDALVDSIRAQGINTPIQIFFDTSKQTFTVISGERRVRAFLKIKEEQPEDDIKIPVIVSVADGSNEKVETHQRINSVLSNHLSAQLTQVDKMRGYKLLRKKGLSIREIARICGKDRKTVERSLQLAEFPDDVLKFIEKNEEFLKARHVEILGQKLRQSIRDLEVKHLSDYKEKDPSKKKESPELKTAADTSENEEKAPPVNSAPVQKKQKPKVSNKEIKTEISKLDTKQKEKLDSVISKLRNEAMEALQTAVDRKKNKKNKTEEQKAEEKKVKLYSRKFDIRDLKKALEDKFSAEDILEIVKIVDNVNVLANSAADQQDNSH
ncbi:MAG: hypothetical protein CMP10_10395 [Zetaproteobacteria bacterium]|nr:hypothetical protein [Pseudobdellovibrionaceae bacterium]|tara:strand:+ start:929 stop:2023 length:1095 start_codon:yes stop_codon:yes gene_type:complete